MKVRSSLISRLIGEGGGFAGPGGGIGGGHLPPPVGPGGGEGGPPLPPVFEPEDGSNDVPVGLKKSSTGKFAPRATNPK